MMNGTYNVTLTVYDTAGNSGSFSAEIIVDDGNEPPVASFTFAPDPAEPRSGNHL